ncbi:histone-binding protein RBBP4 or subunit C of CAF1 complex-domain-containing protein [Baffinella frigidus]|nr:histone-binding protein RBBP4 or subunit C of CAF1 complex-domain-containing protein [Cryptophyta sp. CCMP2293]
MANGVLEDVEAPGCLIRDREVQRRMGGAGTGASGTDDDLEDKFINEQYKNWKVNSRFLYDVVMSHALEWPSLTVQWLPDTYASPGEGLSERRLIIGNHTSEADQNYLMVVRCILPDDGSAEGGMPEERVRGARVEIVKRINHEGEVNRARCMPQRSNMVATKAPSGDVLVFDINAQPDKPSTDGICRPDLKLTGHDKEGYGLSWNTMVAGRVLSGSDDSTICVW